jgi:hypothetical protein
MKFILGIIFGYFIGSVGMTNVLIFMHGFTETFKQGIQEPKQNMNQNLLLQKGPMT